LAAAMRRRPALPEERNRRETNEIVDCGIAELKN